MEESIIKIENSVMKNIDATYDYQLCAWIPHHDETDILPVDTISDVENEEHSVLENVEADNDHSFDHDDVSIVSFDTIGEEGKMDYPALVNDEVVNFLSYSARQSLLKSRDATQSLISYTQATVPVVISLVKEKGSPVVESFKEISTSAIAEIHARAESSAVAVVDEIKKRAVPSDPPHTDLSDLRESSQEYVLNTEVKTLKQEVITEQPKPKIEEPNISIAPCDEDGPTASESVELTPMMTHHQTANVSEARAKHSDGKKPSQAKNYIDQILQAEEKKVANLTAAEYQANKQLAESLRAKAEAQHAEAEAIRTKIKAKKAELEKLSKRKRTFEWVNSGFR